MIAFRVHNTYEVKISALIKQVALCDDVHVKLCHVAAPPIAKNLKHTISAVTVASYPQDINFEKQQLRKKETTEWKPSTISGKYEPLLASQRKS